MTRSQWSRDRSTRCRRSRWWPCCRWCWAWDCWCLMAIRRSCARAWPCPPSPNSPCSAATPWPCWTSCRTISLYLTLHFFSLLLPLNPLLRARVNDWLIECEPPYFLSKFEIWYLDSNWTGQPSPLQGTCRWRGDWRCQVPSTTDCCSDCWRRCCSQVALTATTTTCGEREFCSE